MSDSDYRRAVFCRNAAKQGVRLSQAVPRRLVGRIDVDAAVRTGQHAGGRTAIATETQHRLHHGRRHRLEQPSIYHRGLMVGETPNIDRIGNEGAIFMDVYAEQSCTAGRNAFFTGMYPLRTALIPTATAGQPVLSTARHSSARSDFCYDLGYTTGEFGKNHLGDHTAALPTAHGFRNIGVISIISMPCRA